jgi:hypothetical protein
VLGFYENFPASIHMVETFSSVLSSRVLQQKLIHLFCEANKKEFSFEEVAIPTIPGCKLFFEFGLADSLSFCFIDEEETEKALDILAKEHLGQMDFFCSIRYYKGKPEKKNALKFDYYLFRTIYGKNLFEIQVHHERGPRYLSPEDLTMFIFNRINEGSNRKTLKKTNTI